MQIYHLKFSSTAYLFLKNESQFLTYFANCVFFGVCAGKINK